MLLVTLVDAVILRTRSGICVAGRVDPTTLIHVCGTLKIPTRNRMTVGVDSKRVNNGGCLGPALVQSLMSRMGKALMRYYATCNKDHRSGNGR